MQNQDRDSSVGFLAGVMAGAFLGAGLAVLFTPKAGPELREELGESFAGVRDAVGQRYRDFSARARAEFDDVQERVEDAADHARSVVKDVAEGATDAAARVAGRRG